MKALSPDGGKSPQPLREIVPGEGVIVDEDALRPYESDGLTAYRTLPLIVVLPETTEQVSEILRYCQENSVKVVPRGAGTSLSGGALPLADGIILGLGKFKKILEIDYGNRCAVVQPGVTNLGITDAVREDGFYYAPDRRVRSPARSAAILPRIPAACIP